MGLSATLNIAQGALSTNGALTTVVSRNIAGVNDPGYSRKIASLSSTADGSGATVSISRATDTALFNHLLSATSSSAASSALSSGLDQLEQTVNLTQSASAGEGATTASGNSPADLLGSLTMHCRPSRPRQATRRRAKPFDQRASDGHEPQSSLADRPERP